METLRRCIYNAERVRSVLRKTSEKRPSVKIGRWLLSLRRAAVLYVGILSAAGCATGGRLNQGDLRSHLEQIATPPLVAGRAAPGDGQGGIQSDRIGYYKVVVPLRIYRVYSSESGRENGPWWSP